MSDMGRLQSMNDEESAVVKGPTSQFGRRAAYAALCKHQFAEHGSCSISLFQMLSLFLLESFVLKKHSRVPKPGNITVNDLGNVFVFCYCNSFLFRYLRFTLVFSVRLIAQTSNHHENESVHEV